MAPTVTMTWNWKWSLAATGATAMAGWLASPPLEPAGPAAAPRPSPHRSRTSARRRWRRSGAGPASELAACAPAGRRNAGAQSVPVRHASGGPACASRGRARGRAGGRGRASAVSAAARRHCRGHDRWRGHAHGDHQRSRRHRAGQGWRACGARLPGRDGRRFVRRGRAVERRRPRATHLGPSLGPA